ncbi:hypothetical protein GCM10027294_40770 [Marinactinospora endophytica]
MSPGRAEGGELLYGVRPPFLGRAHTVSSASARMSRCPDTRTSPFRALGVVRRSVAAGRAEVPGTVVPGRLGTGLGA